jgi:hypothetical protein
VFYNSLHDYALEPFRADHSTTMESKKFQTENPSYLQIGWQVW